MEIKIPTFNQTKKEDQPWLLSYSDMVTLLLAFFVLFFSISQIDQVKFEMIMEYFSKSLPAQAGETMPLHQLEKKFKELVEQHNLQQSVDVALTPEGLLVNFQDNILFDSGKADLKENSLPVLIALADILKAPGVMERRIQVEGHTDSVPLVKNSPYPSNWELSTARSSSVIRNLLENGIGAQRFVAVGYADTRLKVEETPDNRGLMINRRVSLLIK
ncbi:MAG TPA: flagellar motor protein MotB [bacterium]